MKIRSLPPRIRTGDTLRVQAVSPPDVRIRGRRLQAIRLQQYKEQPYCVECLKVGVHRLYDELDHIIPLDPRHGGTETKANRRPLCREHHEVVTAQQFGFKTVKAAKS